MRRNYPLIHKEGTVPCNKCNGRGGWKPNVTCSNCHGTGYVPSSQKSEDVK